MHILTNSVLLVLEVSGIQCAFPHSLYSQPRRGSESKIISTGKHSYGIKKIRIRSWGEGANLYIGSFCSIANGNTVFLGGNHRGDWGTTCPFGHVNMEAFPNGIVNGKDGHPVSKGNVIIQNDVWIGSSCTIMSGVTIGSGSILAAGSLVSKNVPPYAIVGGNPAKIIKYRFSEAIIAEFLRLGWWGLPDEEINKSIPFLQQAPTHDVFHQIRSALVKE